MWDEAKQQRFQQLRQRDLDSLLSENERAELAALIQEMDDDEATYLGPADERLHSERQRLEAQNRSLQRVVERRATLAARLRTILDDVTRERNQIDNDLTAVLIQTGDEAETMEGIRQGLDDVEHGRTRPFREVFDEVRRKHGIHPYGARGRLKMSDLS